MLEFKSIRWKNFLSTGDQFTEVYLNKSPTTLILGTNGAGKSTVLDALTFGLFGKPFRKINKPQLVNSVNSKDCLIEIDFSIGKNEYLIRRGIKPAIFEIYINGNMINQDSKIKDYQRHLEENILKLNFKSFTQTVILGSATFVPFMQLSAKDRRDIIEDLLDIKIFSSMNEILKTRILEHRENLNSVDSELNLVDNKIYMQEQSIEEINKDRNKLIDVCHSNIEKYSDQILNAESKIESINDKISDLKNSSDNETTLRTKLYKMDSIQSALATKLASVRKDIEFFQDLDTCPTCRQGVDDTHKNSILQERALKEEELNNAIQDFNSEYSLVASDLKAAAKVNENITELTSSVLEENSNIKSLRNMIDEQQSQIVELESCDESTEKLRSDLKNFNDEKKKLEKTRNSLLDDREYYNVSSMLLKDSGIKTSIVKYYLPIMNNLINKYLHQMDFYVNFKMDESFSEKIESRNRENFSYSSFSEGEKMRIDLALLFTWREVAKMKNSVNTNLLILDEVFDSSLDVNGTDEFLKLLNELGGNNVFVISHKGEILYDKFRSVIKFDKVKNFSKIVEEK